MLYRKKGKRDLGAMTGIPVTDVFSWNLMGSKPDEKLFKSQQVENKMCKTDEADAEKHQDCVLSSVKCVL
jgi:hypothetical protein